MKATAEMLSCGRSTIWSIIALLLVLGAAVRACNFDGSGIVTDRQYRSKLIARAYYLDGMDSVPEWRKTVAAASSRRQEPLEPQVTEAVVAFVYRLVGRESDFVAKIITSLLWFLGAVPLFLIARGVSCKSSAVIATAYYLLLPSGVLTSLSFLPEPLMVLAMLCSVLAVMRFWEEPSGMRLAAAAVVSSLAILLKPLIVFVIFGAFTALAVYHRGYRRCIDRRFVLFAIVALIPGLLYYGKGIVFEDYLRWKVDVSFVPHLFLSKTFWRGWLFSGTQTVGFAPLLITILGLPRVAHSPGKYLVIGLWFGYFLFCLTFNYFIYFAPYYHTQLIPVMALSLGLTLALLWSHLVRFGTRWYPWVPVIVVSILLLVSLWRKVEQGHVTPRFVGTRVAAEIGELVKHSDRVAYLAGTYGLPLEYHGELAGEYWPRSVRSWPLAHLHPQPVSIRERFNSLGFVPQYFVITSFSEYERHHSDLRAFLEKYCLLLADNDQYLIFEIPDQALEYL